MAIDRDAWDARVGVAVEELTVCSLIWELADRVSDAYGCPHDSALACSRM
jgi:hypothetical protein